MFVVQQMELIKSRSGNLPMRFFIKVAERTGIGKNLVELLCHLQPDRLFKLQRQRVAYRSVRLDFTGPLMKPGLSGSACIMISLCHVWSSLDDCDAAIAVLPLRVAEAMQCCASEHAVPPVLISHAH
jgi:hypothetical protein